MSTNTCGLREALLSLRDRSPLDCPCFDPCLMDCWLSFFHALQWTAAEVSTRFFPCIPGDVCPPFLSHKRMLLSSFFACAFSTVPLLFSFLAVAVNSNSCGPVQWQYRASTWYFLCERASVQSLQLLRLQQLQPQWQLHYITLHYTTHTNYTAAHYSYNYK